MKERERAHRKSEASEENFRNIIYNSVDGVVILDEDGIVLFVNPAAEVLFGRKAEELVGKGFGYTEVKDGSSELDITSADGSHRVVELTTAETSWEGRMAHIWSLRDITARKLLEDRLREALDNAEKTMNGVIEALVLTVESRDPYTAGHQERVARLARAIGQEMGLSSKEVDGLYLAAKLHDIGKISIPAEILGSPSRLRDIELKLIQPHPRTAYQILDPVPFFRPIYQVVLQHHERMDGSGYPQGLSDDDILLEARILGAADVVEAMTSHRTYRPAQVIEKALEEISGNSGSLYDPRVVDACLRLFNEKGFDLDREECLKEPPDLNPI